MYKLANKSRLLARSRFLARGACRLDYWLEADSSTSGAASASMLSLSLGSSSSSGSVSAPVSTSSSDDGSSAEESLVAEEGGSTVSIGVNSGGGCGGVAASGNLTLKPKPSRCRTITLLSIRAFFTTSSVRRWLTSPGYGPSPPSRSFRLGAEFRSQPSKVTEYLMERTHYYYYIYFHCIHCRTETYP